MGFNLYIQTQEKMQEMNCDILNYILKVFLICSVCICVCVSDSNCLDWNPGSDIISCVALDKLFNLSFLIYKIEE